MPNVISALFLLNFMLFYDSKQWVVLKTKHVLDSEQWTPTKTAGAMTLEMVRLRAYTCIDVNVVRVETQRNIQSEF